MEQPIRLPQYAAHRKRHGMAGATDTSWRAVAVTTAAAAIALTTRLSPMWMLVIGGVLGGLGVL